MRKVFTVFGLLAVMLFFAPAYPALAASVTITFSTEEEEIHAGDEVEVTMTLESTDTMGDFEAYLNYDSSVLEFSSAPACITGGGGRLRISDIGASASRQERTYRIRFLALMQGDCELSVYGKPVVYGYTDGLEMSVTSVSKTITVLAAEGASGNSRLASLKVVDGTTAIVPLTPQFSPDVLTYFSAVPYEAERLILSAVADDSRSTVSVAGEENLAIGSNTVTVKVTAENGTSTEYTIYVHRAETPDEPETGDEQTGTDEIQKGIAFSVDMENPANGVLMTEYHTYTAVSKPEEFTIPEGYEKTYLMLNEIQVEAYAKRDGTLAEFLLLVLQNEAGEVNWYSYDRVEQTIQRVNEERFTIQQVTSQEEDALQQTIEQYRQKQETMLFVMALLCGLCMMLLLILIVGLLLRHRRKQKSMD